MNVEVVLNDVGAEVQNADGIEAPALRNGLVAGLSAEESRRVGHEAFLKRTG
jgi:hypothetical protein